MAPSQRPSGPEQKALTLKGAQRWTDERGCHFLSLIYFEPDDYLFSVGVGGRPAGGRTVTLNHLQVAVARAQLRGRSRTRTEGRAYARTAQDLRGLLRLQRTLTAPFGAADSLWIYLHQGNIKKGLVESKVIERLCCKNIFGLLKTPWNLIGYIKGKPPGA